MRSPSLGPSKPENKVGFCAASTLGVWVPAVLTQGPHLDPGRSWFLPLQTWGLFVI